MGFFDSLTGDISEGFGDIGKVVSHIPIIGGVVGAAEGVTKSAGTGAEKVVSTAVSTDQSVGAAVSSVASTASKTASGVGSAVVSTSGAVASAAQGVAQAVPSIIQTGESAVSDFSGLLSSPIFLIGAAGVAAVVLMKE